MALVIMLSTRNLFKIAKNYYFELVLRIQYWCLVLAKATLAVTAKLTAIMYFLFVTDFPQTVFSFAANMLE